MSNKLTFRILAALAAAALLALPAGADIKIKTHNGMAGQNFENTVYIKGARERNESSVMGHTSTTIYQCDLKRIVTLFDDQKKYMITPIEVEEVVTSEPGAKPPAPAPKTEAPENPTKLGGTLTLTSASIDTTERQQIFGQTARHVRGLMSVESSPDACSKSRMMMASDGWYIDLQYGMHCSTHRPAMPPMRHEKPDCVDKIRTYTCNTGRLGYPLKLTTTVYTEEGGRTMTMTQETVDLSTALLDQKLFEIPAGYTEMKMPAGYGGMPTAPPSTSAAAAAAASESGGTTPGAPGPKAAGTIRIGVVLVDNKTGVTVPQQQETVVSYIRRALLDAIPLNATDEAAARKEAKEKECDYILYSSITNMKTASTGSKVGGFFGKAVGAGGTGNVESAVSYRLFQIDQEKPQLEASQSAREGSTAEDSVKVSLEREVRDVVANIHKMR